MKYDILSSQMPDQLAEKVNRALSDGWDLQGGVSVAIRLTGRYIFCQAVTMTEPDTEDQHVRELSSIGEHTTHDDIQVAVQAAMVNVEAVS